MLHSTPLHLPPLRFHCVRRMLGSNPGLLQLRYWQSDALTTRVISPDILSGFKPVLRIPDPDPGFWWPKLWKNYQLTKKLHLFDQTPAIYLLLGLHKGHSSYRRSLNPSKENTHYYFKSWIFFTFMCLSFTSMCHFCPPGSGSAFPKSSRPRSMRIRIPNTGLNQCCGSGMFIPDPGSWFLPIPEPGSRSQKKQQKRGAKKFFYHTLL